MLINRENLEFKPGTTTILSVWPAMGKTAATEIYKNEKTLTVIDFDSGVFRDTHGLVDNQEEFVTRYVDEIESLSKIVQRDCARVILVASNNQVADEMIRRNMDFTTIAPTPDVVPLYAERAKTRAEENPTRANQAASAFLNSNKALRAAESAYNSAIDTFMTEVLLVRQELPGQLVWMSDIIAAGWKNGRIAAAAQRCIMSEFWKQHSWCDLNSESTLEAFIDSNRRAVIRSKDSVKPELLEKISELTDIPESELKFGLPYRNTDVVTISKSDALELLEIYNSLWDSLGVTNLGTIERMNMSYLRLKDRVESVLYADNK